MNLSDIYKRFPKQEDCIKYLEDIRWKGNPSCPYCRVSYYTMLNKEKRYHCNNCNTSFSVTVRTMFHKTKLPLQKWFFAIFLILNAKGNISARQLAKDINVNKDTAWYMNVKIRRAMIEERELLDGFVKIDET
jgi:transposase-like protein